jgi:hypothetical protein
MNLCQKCAVRGHASGYGGILKLKEKQRAEKRLFFTEIFCLFVWKIQLQEVYMNRHNLVLFLGCFGVGLTRIYWV